MPRSTDNDIIGFQFIATMKANTGNKITFEFGADAVEEVARLWVYNSKHEKAFQVAVVPYNPPIGTDNP